MQAERNKRAVSGRPPRLLEADFHRLRADIKQPPAAFGFDALKWSGRLLAELLLANYGVVLGLRQCRRILHSSGLRTSGAVALTPSVPKHSVESKSQKTASPWPISDSANKQRALTRIKRLCSSGLPLYPLAQALFELLNDAIPHGANRVLLADDGRHPDRYVVSSSELAGWGPIHKHFYVDSPPQVSGTLPVRTILEGKTVWRHEEIALAHFYRSEGYNECMRHIGFHHALMINLRDHLGLSGNYPMWRTSEMKPFTVDDVRFAEAAAPYIAHALSVASRVASVPERVSEFAPLDAFGQGVIVLGSGGRVNAADAAARAIFQQLALFDGHPADLFGDRRVQSALAYIQQTLGAVFEDRADPFANPNSPAVQLYRHRVGLVLKLRGVVVDSQAGTDRSVVLVEAGEHPEHRQRRIMYRYGLTPRLMELLSLMGSGMSSAEVATHMRLSRFTVNDYIERLKELLEVPDRTSLRRFAAQLGAGK